MSFALALLLASEPGCIVRPLRPGVILVRCVGKATATWRDVGPDRDAAIEAEDDRIRRDYDGRGQIGVVSVAGDSGEFELRWLVVTPIGLPNIIVTLTLRRSGARWLAGPTRETLDP